MRLIVGSSLKFRFLVAAAAAALIGFGTTLVGDAQVDVFPEFAPPKVEIQTIALGLSAAEVEDLITVPLEQALAGIPDLDAIRSKSVPQLSDIVVIFDRGTDLLPSRQLVAERVASISPTLPSWAAPPVIIQPLSSTSRVMKIGLTSDQMSLIDLSVVAYWKMRARLLRVPGVANVPIWGERLHQLQVQVEPERMQELGITLDDVLEGTANSLDIGTLISWSDGALIGSGGFIDTPNQRLGIRHVPPVVTAEALGQVAIAGPGGQPVPLTEFADVRVDHQPLIGDAVINGGPGLMLIVEKLPWANTLEVTRGVEEALQDLQPGLPGIEIDAEIFRPATFIEESIDNLTWALILGAILVVVILALFLFEWRIALISVLAIPLSLLAAALVLILRGTTINVMVLAGFVIALGAVVDDAIIDAENIVRRLRQNRRQGLGKSTARVILEASLEVRSAIVYATLILLIAVLPIFFLQGLSGAFFQPLVLAYGLALLASMGVALTVTPALCLILLDKAPIEKRESPLIRWLQAGYDRLLKRLLRRPRWGYLAAVACLIAGGVSVPFLGQELLPSFKERDFLMHWLTEPATSSEEEYRISVAACQELQEIDGVRNCGAHIGQAFLSDEPYGVYFGENWVSVDPSVDYDATLALIQGVVDGYPGIQRDVQTYLKERIREVLTGSSGGIVVRINCPDFDALRSEADAILEIVKGIDGVSEPRVSLVSNTPQIDVEVDLEAARRHGLKPGDVRRASAVLVAGEEVGDVFQNGRAYDVQVWSTPETRNSLTSIVELPLDTPSGEVIRLGDVADVRISPSPNTIKRENLTRYIDVEANVSGKDLGSVTRDVERAIKEYNFPLEYRAEVLGEFKERQSAQRRMAFLGIIAALGTFLLLQASFRSWRLVTMAFFTLPIALMGGVLAALAGGGVLSLGSLVGFFTVFGIAARNGILMITHFQHLEKHEGETFGPELVLRGARERLAPILMTALTTALALVPLVARGNIAGQEIEYPLAIVILGGLGTSTLLNLFVVPALYLKFGKSRGERRLAPSTA